jgi:NAD(P)-dependent dehydrogenase (short-subunit alcohol dehydrogenase family)
MTASWLVREGRNVMGSFKDKVVLITGGSSGLGAATALRFAREGANVAIGARRTEQSEAVVRQIECLGGQGLFIRTDVRQPADIEALVYGTVARFGRLDCAINNAGITGQVLTPIADIEKNAWDETISANLTAVFLGMKYEIPAMLKNGGGAIANVASIYGQKADSIGAAAYCATRFAVVGLTKTAAIDYGQRGIRVNAICPGFAQSEMVDPFPRDAPDLMKMAIDHNSASGRVGEADEIVDVIAFLCSHSARFVNGAELAIDGGDKVRLADRNGPGAATGAPRINNNGGT